MKTGDSNGGFGVSDTRSTLQQVRALVEAGLSTFDRLAALARQTLDLDRAVVGLIDPAGASIVGRSGAEREPPTAVLLALQRPAIRAALARGEMVDNHHLPPSDQTIPADAWLATPIQLSAGQFLGVLWLESNSSRGWTELDIALIHDLIATTVTEIELRLAAQATETEHSAMSAILERIADAFFALDREGRFTFVNQAAERLMQRSASQLLGKVVWEEFGSFIEPEIVERYRAAVDDQQVLEFEAYFPPVNAWFSVHVYPSEDGASVHLDDVTLRKDAEEALRQSEQRFRALVQSALDVILVVQPDGTIQFATPSVERLLGYRPEALLGQGLFELIFPDDRDAVRQAIDEMLRNPSLSVPFEFRFRHRNMEWRFLEASGNSSLETPGINGIVISAHDVTDRKSIENQLVFQAFHDPLTGLPNRTLFLDRLSHALTWANRRKESVAVLFLDLDRFKQINDSLGHATGDQLLIAVGQRVQSCLRSIDTVSRFGGDEFTILLEDIADPKVALDIAQRIIDVVSAPYSIELREIFITTSIGIAFSEPGSSKPDDLLRDADAALYRAKAKGRARFQVFNPRMHAIVLNRRKLEQDLRLAIKRDELLLNYQPAVDFQTGRIVSIEALARWQHPKRGLVPPAEFIPVAEESGMIAPLFDWILETACRQLKDWQLRYPEYSSLALSVNLSVRHLRQVGIADLIARVLDQTGLHSSHLKLEIAENAVAEDRKTIDAVLRKLRRIGVLLAVDDFGGGYSSLSSLRQLPVDALIIDQSFVAGLKNDQESAAIVRAIVMLARTLGLQVTAKGIETAEDFEQARALGCDLGQGYFVSRPLNDQAMSELLESGLSLIPVLF